MSVGIIVIIRPDDRYPYAQKVAEELDDSHCVV